MNERKERWKEGKGGRKGGRGRKGRREGGRREQKRGYLIELVVSRAIVIQFMTELSVVCPLVVWFNGL